MALNRRPKKDAEAAKPQTQTTEAESTEEELQEKYAEEAEAAEEARVLAAEEAEDLSATEIEEVREAEAREAEEANALAAEKAAAAKTKAKKKAPAKPADKQVMTRESTAVSTDVQEIKSIVAIKDALSQDEFEYGDLPRIVANNNMIYGPDRLKLGSFIDVQVLSYSDRITISPGSDEDDAKQFVRVSYDGVTIHHAGDDHGRDVEEYIGWLKTSDTYYVEGEEKSKDLFPRAARKPYIDVFCFLIDGENEDNVEELSIEGIVQVSLSPMSKGKFNAYAKQLILTVKRGLVSPEKSRIVRFRTVVKSSGTRDFTLLVPGASPKEVSDNYEPIDLV